MTNLVLEEEDAGNRDMWRNLVLDKGRLSQIEHIFG